MVNKRNFTVVVEQDENGMFIGTIPEIKSCYTQAPTLDELLPRIKEVAELCLDEEKKNLSNNKFIGIQQIEVACA